MGPFILCNWTCLIRLLYEQRHRPLNPRPPPRCISEQCGHQFGPRISFPDSCGGDCGGHAHGYETNVFAVVRVTNAFMPLLLRSKAGRIVNVTSKRGPIGEEGAWGVGLTCPTPLPKPLSTR
jgi:hypothetical protein